MCIRKASLANGKKSWYIGARLEDAGNWLDSKAYTVDRKMLWRRAAGDPHSPGLQRLKNWAGALLLNLPTPLNDGEEPGLVPRRPQWRRHCGQQRARGRLAAQIRASHSRASPVRCRRSRGRAHAELAAPTVCFQSTATQGDSCGPPARGGGRARGHLGVLVGGHRASVGSDRSRGARATHSTWASSHLSPPPPVSSRRGFQVKVLGNLIFTPSTLSIQG